MQEVAAGNSRGVEAACQGLAYVCQIIIFPSQHPSRCLPTEIFAYAKCQPEQFQRLVWYFLAIVPKARISYYPWRGNNHGIALRNLCRHAGRKEKRRHHFLSVVPPLMLCQEIRGAMLWHLSRKAWARPHVDVLILTFHGSRLCIMTCWHQDSYLLINFFPLRITMPLAALLTRCPAIL